MGDKCLHRPNGEHHPLADIGPDGKVIYRCLWCGEVCEPLPENPKEKLGKEGGE
jgi:hypothetical protein